MCCGAGGGQGTGEIRVNRAPVLTLWAAVVAERLGHDSDLAITLGRAVAGSSARAKARAIGLEDDGSAEEEHARQRHDRTAGQGQRDAAPARTVRLLGRDVPVAETGQGLHALDHDRPAAPVSGGENPRVDGAQFITITYRHLDRAVYASCH